MIDEAFVFAYVASRCAHCVHCRLRRRRMQKTMKTETIGGGVLFGGAKHLHRPPQQQQADETGPTLAAGGQYDPVIVELERYAYLAPELLKPYIKSDGMLNHSKCCGICVTASRCTTFFTQISSHLPHEANVEESFSRAVSQPRAAPPLSCTA